MGRIDSRAVMRVLSVVGNRPQFVKSGPLSLAYREGGIEEVVLHTGQHYDRELSAVFFEELDLPRPAYNLEVGSGSHATQTARMLPGIEEVVLAEQPDAVVVLGDTNSTLAGALAAAKVHVPVAHVEAGLRSFDRTMPEEVNRVLVDALSSLLLCPSDTSVTNLRREGIVEGVREVGDVMYDANQRFGPIARERSFALTHSEVAPGRYVLATVHREANVAPEPLARIVEGLGRLDEPVVFPAHPRTRAALADLDLSIPGNVRLRPPAGYLDFAALASQARVVATDSGGVQKEAYWFGVPCVTLRERTEWVETIETGWNTLAGTDSDAIAKAIERAGQGHHHPPLYGDGQAAERIARLLYTISE
jgi:UDP-GlcNAc3NAcA epimerase